MEGRVEVLLMKPTKTDCGRVSRRLSDSLVTQHSWGSQNYECQVSLVLIEVAGFRYTLFISLLTSP